MSVLAVRWTSWTQGKVGFGWTAAHVGQQRRARGSRLAARSIGPDGQGVVREGRVVRGAERCRLGLLSEGS
jgi:hypothetical protein